MSNGPRVAVVTGTSGGLGGAIASSLAHHGYTIVGVSRRNVAASQLGLSKNEYKHINWDLADIASLKSLSSKIVKQYGNVYALVNNAALGTDGLLATMHDRQIEELIRVNIVSPITLTKYLIRPMLSERSGRIVNISSIVARTGYRGLAAYGASKAALEGFTRSLARDVGRRNVTVNSVAPGFLETEMTAGIGERNLERIEHRSALRRFATTAEVSSAVAYLLSDSASGVTGTVLTVDGGSSA